MPELPDLQIFSSNIHRKLKGKKLKAVSVPERRKLKTPVATVKKTLEGQTLVKVYRDGKELFFKFSKGDVLSLHLMMHGNLYFFNDKNTNKHTIIELLFTDGTGLALTDWQRAATPTLNPEAPAAPDALSKEVTFSFMKKLLQRKSTLKNVLLDQKLIRGIGNAYADEICWDARISPFSISNKIPDDKVKALHVSMRRVLKNAEKTIRKADPARIAGELRDFLTIHHAKRKTSPGGAQVRHRVIGGRKTYYTDEQVEYT